MHIITAAGLSHHVHVGDSTVQILKNIDLKIEPGESVAIVGKSGSGKSTLLGLLAGLDVPAEGEILINDLSITDMDEEQRANIRSQYVSFVFQNFQLLHSLTALENVMLPMEIHHREDAMSTAKDFLDKVGLSHRLHHYPQQLSGGEQQRVAIARAFGCKAPILFADEPTGNLDADTGATVSDILFDLNAQTDTTLVLVTHDQSLAKRCDRVLNMAAGQLTE